MGHKLEDNTIDELDFNDIDFDNDDDISDDDPSDDIIFKNFGKFNPDVFELDDEAIDELEKKRKKKKRNRTIALISIIVGLVLFLYYGAFGLFAKVYTYDHISFAALEPLAVVEDSKSEVEGVNLHEVRLIGNGVDVTVVQIHMGHEAAMSEVESLFTHMPDGNSAIAHLTDSHHNLDGNVRYYSGISDSGAYVQGLYLILDLKNDNEYQVYITGDQDKYSEITNIYKSVKLDNKYVVDYK